MQKSSLDIQVSIAKKKKKILVLAASQAYIVRSPEKLYLGPIPSQKSLQEREATHRWVYVRFLNFYFDISKQPNLLTEP